MGLQSDQQMGIPLPVTKKIIHNGIRPARGGPFLSCDVLFILAHL